MNHPRRPTPLPEFTPPRQKLGFEELLGIPGAPWLFALVAAAPGAVAVGLLADVHPVAAVAMGLLVWAHFGAILSARRRYHRWLGLGGCAFSLLVFAATAVVAGPAHHRDDPLAFWSHWQAVADQDLWMDGLRVILSNVLPWFAAVGGYLSTRIRIADFPAR